MCIFIHKLAIAVRIKISKYPRNTTPETLYNLAASRRPRRYGTHACKKKNTYPR
jgi:hypothetical protein